MLKLEESITDYIRANSCTLRCVEAVAAMLQSVVFMMTRLLLLHSVASLDIDDGISILPG